MYSYTAPILHLNQNRFTAVRKNHFQHILQKTLSVEMLAGALSYVRLKLENWLRNTFCHFFNDMHASLYRSMYTIRNNKYICFGYLGIAR